MNQATLEAMSEAGASLTRGGRAATDVGCFVGIASSDYEALCERSRVQVSEGVNLCERSQVQVSEGVK